MSYQKLVKFLEKFFTPSAIFKHGFNLSPMYRRSVGRVIHVSKDLHIITIEIPLNYKNRNYVGSIFGGSLFSATDPIYMIQLIHILGDEYVVWDKSAKISYKKPARSKAFVQFKFTTSEIEKIRTEVDQLGRIDIIKTLNIESKTGEVFAELEKTLYVSTKRYYKLKTLAKNKETTQN